MNQANVQRMMIGEATFPSGIALLVDFGTLHSWQRTRPPVWPAARGVVRVGVLFDDGEGADDHSN